MSEIAKWERLADEAEHEVEPVMTELIEWLKANAPVTERLTLVHGAYRTGNFLVDDDRVSAVLDWELQVIGDPMYDVAYVLSPLNREGTDLLSNLVERDLFVERYEAATGLTIDEDVCQYYEMLYRLRSAAFWMSASGSTRRARTVIYASPALRTPCPRSSTWQLASSGSEPRPRSVHRRVLGDLLGCPSVRPVGRQVGAGGPKTVGDHHAGSDPGVPGALHPRPRERVAGQEQRVLTLQGHTTRLGPQRPWCRMPPTLDQGVDR